MNTASNTHCSAFAILQLTLGERFALVTALDDRRQQLERDAERGAKYGGDTSQTKRREIIANIDSVRGKLAPLLENPKDPRPGVSYKE